MGRGPLRAEERSLAAALRATIDHRAFRSKGFAYDGPRDFVLRHGSWYRPALSPYLQGGPRLCFGNAINIVGFFAAGVPELRYVEGYATSDAAEGIPIHHAWVTAGHGVAWDVTWGVFDNLTRRQVATLPEAAYLGVEFSLGRADDATWNGDATVLDDWERDWPLLREEWGGEDWEREWPTSRRLDVLRLRAAGNVAGALEALRELEQDV